MARERAEGRLGLRHWLLISEVIKFEWNVGDDAVALRDLQSPARMRSHGRRLWAASSACRICQRTRKGRAKILGVFDKRSPGAI